MTQPPGPGAGEPLPGGSPLPPSDPPGAASPGVGPAPYPGYGAEPAPYPPPGGGAAPYPPPGAAPYGGGVMPAGMYVDPTSGLLLPQGTQLAPIGRRIGAFFLAFPLLIVTLVIGYLIWGLVVWGRGQTPALQVLGMRCWRPETGQPASFGWMALREIVGRLVEGLLGGITQLISFVLMLTSPERKSLHDLIAGTVVIHDPNKVLG